MPTTLVHTAELSTGARDLITTLIPGELEACGNHTRLHHPREVSGDALTSLRSRLPFDINPLPHDFRGDQVRLVVSDMDSTLITIECLDELAAFAGKRGQVAALTAAAMRGEIDFAASLRERLALLRGLDVAVLETVYRERMRLSRGARELLAGLEQRTIPCALISGGATFFTERLQRELGLAYSRGITLELEGRELTGRTAGEVIDAWAKAAFLREICTEEGIAPGQSIALGDGANDLMMLKAAGLGVAFRGKPLLQAAADVVLNHSGLEAVLDFIG